MGPKNFSTNDYRLQLSQGKIAKQFGIYKFGRNADIDTGTEDIWSNGGLFVLPTVARVHAIVSSSANDTSAGTGMRTLTIEGLDTNYNQITETVTLNGITPVNTANSYTMINRMYGFTAGTGLVNAGTITATAATDATITATIAIGEGQTLQAIYMVPAGYTAYLTDLSYTAQAGTIAVDIRLLGIDFGGCQRTRHMHNLTTPFDAETRLNIKMAFAEKCLIKVQVTSTGNNVDMSANFELVLVSNT